MSDRDELVTIGRIERPFGVRGEVKLRSLSDVPGRFDGLREVTLVSPDGKTVRTTVTGVRRAGSAFIVGLAGYGSPEQAKALRGAWVQIVRGAPPPLPEGQYYECDLIGMAVLDEHGHSLGVVDRVLDLSGNHVFAVRRGAQELLVPAARDLISRVDVERHELTVREIEGLEYQDAV